MGKVIAVCISEKKGTQKTNIHQARFIKDWGLKVTPTQESGTVRSVFYLMKKFRLLEIRERR